MKHYFWLIAYGLPYKSRIAMTWLISITIVILQTISLWISVQCIQNILLGKSPIPGSQNFLLAWLDKVTMNVLSNRPPYETLIAGALCLTIILFSISLLRYWKSYIFVNINERILAKIRYDIFQHITTLDLLFTQSKKTGEVGSLLFHDVDNLTWGLLDSLDRIFLQPLRIIFFTYLLYQLSPALTLVLYFVIAINFILTHYLGKYLESKSRILMEKTASLHGNAVEYLILAVLARIFNKENYELLRWQNKCKDLANAKITSRIMQDLFPIITSFSKSVSLLLIILIGGKLVYVENFLITTDLAKIALLIPMLLYPMEALATLYGSIRISLASIKRIRNILDETSVAANDQNHQSLPALKNPIFPVILHSICKNIAGRTILDNVNLIINQNSTIVLYGPSGSGKSTLLSILAGLSTAESGTVSIGENKLSEIDHHSWRDRLSIVLQDSLFFNTTIRENFAYAGVKYSEKEMMEVLQRIFPHDFTFSQPSILDNEMGNQGKNFSGGEKQRLSIARALLKKPDLLILDEPTSDLDQANKDVIYEIINNLRGTFTMIIATHDDRIKELADQVFLIKDASLVEVLKNNG